MNEDRKDGGPAFPVTIGSQIDQHICGSGMTLRDWFAGQAISSLLELTIHIESSGGILGGSAQDSAAKAAYEMADAMLKRRERK